jgi:hypothetical protein
MWDAPSALPKAEAARLRGDYDEPPEADADLEERLRAASERPEADAEPEHQERSALAKLAALREQVAVPVAGLEERLWAALDRSVDLLEARLEQADYVLMIPGPVDRDAAAVRNIAETMDRLGLLKPPPVRA